MQFTVTISTDNAAFHDPTDGGDDEAYLRDELAAILRSLRTKVTSASPLAERDADDPFRLYDSNGALVGIARFEQEG